MSFRACQEILCMQDSDFSIPLRYTRDDTILLIVEYKLWIKT
ncbi:MAG: hypothetical protein ACD_56C00149G0002 [uncultured bacterium]|nr:MAG: hypothetical protein ACD_56C00149G0002 [uncultured bacterium]